MRGLSISTSARLHSLQKSTIDVNRRRIGSLAGDVNFEISEKISNNHPIEKIPTRNYKVLR